MLSHQSKSSSGITFMVKSLVCPRNPGKCSLLFCCIICTIETLENMLPSTVSELRSRKLGWVYPHLNVALPFSVASLCVGDRVCTCISVCQCVPMWVCVCERAFVRARGRLYESEALCINVCSVVWLARGQVWVPGISRTDVKDL